MTLRRRDFITLLGGSAIAWPLAARAQLAENTRRVGVLSGFAEGDVVGQSLVAAFRQGLNDHGWIAERNIRIDVRWAAEAEPARMQAYAAELVQMHPDVVLVNGGRAAKAIQNQTRDIPIVFAAVPDPVISGLVQSLAHPGGNITGFTTFEGSHVPKLLELLKAIAPDIRRVGLVINPNIPGATTHMQALQGAATSLGVEPIEIAFRNPVEIEVQIANFAQASGGGLVFSSDVTLLNYRNLAVAVAARHRLPAAYVDHFFVRAGGLLSYGVDRADQYKLAANYVDRILRGEKAGDLPVQQPTKFALIINARSARSLGLTVPSTLLAVADEVIE